MGGGFNAAVMNGSTNLWGDPLLFFEPESEHSAASVCEGFAVAGGRITNFTSGKTAMYMMGSWFLGSVPKATADDFGSFMTPTDDGSLVVPFAVGGSMAISAKTPAPDKATAFAEAWSLDPANYKALIEGDGAFPMLKGKSLADYNVTVSPTFTQSFTYVSDQNNKVSAIGWATNDDAMPGSLNNDFYAAAQALFNTNDVAGQMTKLDQSWATATK